MPRTHFGLIGTLLLTALAACGFDASDEGPAGTVAQAQKGDEGDKEGQRLFEEETFGGNGRTCATCHSAKTGTVSPEDARKRFRKNPGDPLFKWDGSDDGLGNGVTRILERATIRVTITLPPNVSLADDPTARTVTLNRGIPSTLNTPALDPVLMYDARAPSLELQALGAVHDHTQNTIEPTQDQLEKIAAFQKTKSFFSSSKLRKFAAGGPPPELPRGHTASEIRGRAFFVDAPIAISPEGKILTKDGLCALCHSGPMLNEINAFNFFGAPPGLRTFTALVSELNEGGNPVRPYVFTNPDGSTLTIPTPDPGLALTTGIPQTTNFFKIPSLWGITKTAPYFHDSSALTLLEVAEHYRRFFSLVPPTIDLSDQDIRDIVAFMNLL